MGIDRTMNGQPEIEEEHTSFDPMPIPGLSVAHCSRPNTQYGNRSTCVEIVINGFALGAGLGSVVGVLFGGMAAMGEEAKGQRARLFLKAVGGSALSFGVFLAAGSALRCQEAHCEGAQPIQPFRCNNSVMFQPQQQLPAGGLSAIWRPSPK